MKPLHIMVMAAAALPMADLVLSGELSSQYPEANADECDGTSRSSDQGPTPGHKRHRQAEGTSTIGATDPPSTLNIDADIRSPYRIVIDGGSTGSRLHVFEFIQNKTSSEVECVRRGSAKAWTPLSVFGRPPSRSTDPLNSTEVADHLLPLFEYAADIIPQHYHNVTPATYQATAGMRLLDESEQEAVYDALYEGLVESDRFVFRSMSRKDVTTLDGGTEGFYGAVAANYLKGFVGADLKVKGSSSPGTESSSRNNEELSNQVEQTDDWHLPHHGPLGALDMGGASAQIVFLPELVRDGSGEQGGSCSADEPRLTHDGDAGRTCSAPERLDGDTFFSTSYLAYGVDQVRERLWDVWIDDDLRDVDPNACKAKELTIANPCGFNGHKQEWRGYTLVGTGDADACAKQLRRLIPHHEEIVESDVFESDSNAADTRSRVVGGIQHPPLRGKFYAMSLYFFTLDCLRELSGHEGLHLNWPTPSIEELTDALHGLCSRSWHGDLEEIKHNSHAFTLPEILPHRCFESVYMVTLLRDGFGFRPESRDITFLFEVEGSEVEWSLGMALAEAGSLEWLKTEKIKNSHEARNDGMATSEGSVVVTGEARSDRARSRRGDNEDMETNFTWEHECASSQTCPSGLWA